MSSFTPLWCASCGKQVTPPNWVIDGLAYCFWGCGPEPTECD